MADDDFSQGFLSPAVIAVAKLIRNRYAPWIAAFARANRYGVELQHSIQVDGGNRQHVLAACLFARTLSNAQAAVILLGRGMEPQTRAMLRTTLESLFALAAVVTDPALADRFTFAHHIEQRRMFFGAREWTSPELKERAAAAATDDKLKEIEAHISETEAKKISAEALAKAAGLHEWYLTAYGLLSWAVHSTVGDLERHVVYADDGSVQEF
jgi:hypothetical protein